MITILHLTQISLRLHRIIVCLDYCTEFQPFQTGKRQPQQLPLILHGSHTAVRSVSSSKILTSSNLSSSERKWGKSVNLHGSWSTVQVSPELQKMLYNIIHMLCNTPHDQQADVYV